MSTVINTNVLSLNAQRNLSQSNNSLAQSLQRLSSGLRINSAKDDAAGLAISERFTTQIRGLNQASRNANDGVSLAQVGESALQEIQNNLQRIRELAVQSVNATNSESDRKALNAEVQQRLAEIDRTAAQTQFNGARILDGSFGVANFQVGANVGQTISIDVSNNLRTNAYGGVAENTSEVITAFQNESRSGTAFTAAAMLGFTATGVNNSTTEVTIGNRASNFEFSVDGVSVLQTQQATQRSTGAITGIANTAVSGNGVLTIQVQGSNGIVKIGELSFTSSTAVTDTAIAALFETSEAQERLAAAGYSATRLTAGTATDGFRVAREDGRGFQLQITANPTAALGIQQAAINGAFAGLTAANASNSFADTSAATQPALPGTAVRGVVNQDAILNAINNKADELQAQGVRTNGAVALNALKFSRLDGQSFDITMSRNALTGNGFAANAFGTGFGGTAGSVTIDNGQKLNIAAGEFRVRVGDTRESFIDVSGTFDNLNDFADAVMSRVPGVTAVVTKDNELKISAGQTITLDGNASQFGNDVGFARLTAAADGNLRDVDISTVDGANSAILRVDSALDLVSDLRSDLGAIQNRFDSVMTTLSAQSEALSASRSRIRDADFAAETAELTRVQILQQAGTSVLSQANSAPQSVLALLQ